MQAHIDELEEKDLELSVRLDSMSEKLCHCGSSPILSGRGCHEFFMISFIFFLFIF